MGRRQRQRLGPGVRILGLGETTARPGQGRGALPPIPVCAEEGRIGVSRGGEVLAMFSGVGRDLDLFGLAESDKRPGSEARVAILECSQGNSQDIDVEAREVQQMTARDKKLLFGKVEMSLVANHWRSDISAAIFTS